MPTKQELLSRPIEHLDVTRHNVVALVDGMEQMAFSARDLHRAASIYDRMLNDDECAVILTLAGSLISAGLKQIFVDMIRNRMVDCIVSTGANIVDQDFFEALGYRHYVADDRFKAGLDDGLLRDMHIDRIYDTFIDEDELRICDETVQKIADELPPRPYSSREFIRHMGEYLVEHGKTRNSIVLAAHEHDVLGKELRQWVAHEIGAFARPEAIQFAPGLPKTRSGKIMRRILRKIAENDLSNLGDTSTLADPSVVERVFHHIGHSQEEGEAPEPGEQLHPHELLPIDRRLDPRRPRGPEPHRGGD